MCRNLGGMGVTVAICVDAQKVCFALQGDVGKGTTIVSAGDDVTIEASSGETAPLHFPMKCLVGFARPFLCRPRWCSKWASTLLFTLDTWLKAPLRKGTCIFTWRPESCRQSHIGVTAVASARPQISARFAFSRGG